MDPNNPPELTPEMLEQNPVVALCLLGFTLLFMAFVSGTLISWTWLGYCSWKGQTLLPVAAWRPRVWGLADLLVAFAAFVLCQSVVAAIGFSVLDIDVEALRAGEDPPLSFSALISASYLMASALTVGWIVLRYQVGVSHVGFGVSGLPRLLVTGLVAGLACLPFIYALSAAVALGFDTEYEHPILDSMRETGSLTSYFLALFAAVVAAPLAEEFLFRVLIQGWLQSMPFSRILSILWGASESQRNDVHDRNHYFGPGSSTSGTFATADNTPLATAGENALQPYAPVRNESLMPENEAANLAGTEHVGADGSLPMHSTEDLVTDANAQPEHKPPVWPAILTGILFGLAHWGYGLSFVPLIVFGILLGLLYRATQSIWPCVLVHFMLNASSMLALGIGILVQRMTEAN